MFIGLSSLQPQVGKSEVVRHLEKKYNFINTEMSDAICIIADKFFGYNGDKSDPNQRKILQDLGLMGKSIHPTIWFYQALGIARRRKWGLPTNGLISSSFLHFYNLKPMIDEIEEKGIDEFMEGGDVVMGGVRSPSEADEILKIGGKVYLVVRETGEHETKLKAVMDKMDKGVHQVESQLAHYEKFTGIIHNNGTIEELQSKVDSIILGEKPINNYMHFNTPVDWQIPPKKEDKNGLV